MVELELAKLFEVTSGMPNAKAAQAAMAAVVSFKARVAICNAILSFFTLNDLLRKSWTKIVSTMFTKVEHRNQLAHFTIIVAEAENGDAIWQLMPYFSLGKLATKELQGDGVIEGLSLNQIRARAIEFGLLAHALAWFTCEMQVLLGKLRANPKQVPGLVLQVQNPNAQTGAKTKRPPRPPWGTPRKPKTPQA